MSGKLLNANLITRTISGIVLLVVVVAAILLSRWSLLALVLAIGAGCMVEFYRIARMGGTRPQSAYGVALGIALIAATFFVVSGALSYRMLYGMLPLGAAVFIIELYRKHENPLANCAATLMGIFYIALPLALLCAIALPYPNAYPTMRWVVLSYFFIVWANDVGAYLIGVLFGRHRLMERISPKKSWEGFFGGLVLAMGVAALAGYLTGGSPLVWGGLGLVIAATGVWGDLVESMFKRAVDIKDSGAMMPGHGGFLDRFDALVVSLPFAFIYFAIFNL